LLTIIKKLKLKTMDTTANNNDHVTDEQIAALSKHFFDHVHIMENGKIRKLDPTIDTRSIYFEKAKIDKLFADNPGADGLTIHLGMHHPDIFPPRQPGYKDKMMVVLSANTSVKPGMLGGGNGSGGQDNGKICPPDTDC
jgi:hypothetical protein